MHWRKIDQDQFDFAKPLKYHLPTLYYRRVFGSNLSDKFVFTRQKFSLVSGICLDILQNRWSPTYDVSAILTSIQSLLDEPNPNSPANSVAAQLYQVSQS